LTDPIPSKPTQFICLDPRKTKRAAIDASLSPIGPIAFRRFGPLRLKGWPETDARAEQALVAARNVPQNPTVRRLKKTMLAWQYNGARALFTRSPDAVAVAWNGLNGSRRAFMDGAKDAGAARLYYELSPLAGRITVDPCGVNFTNGLPREIAPYLTWFAGSGLVTDIWRRQGHKITARAAGRSPSPSKGAPPLTDRFLFVPLQVPGDSQLRLFGGAYKTVEAFIETLIELSGNLPKGWHLRLKEHPSSPSSVAHFQEKMADRPIFFDNATDTFEQVAASQAVITINSSVGLESMFFDKPVVAVGQCFWAVAGVAHAAPDRTSLAALLAVPDSLGFDPKARDAYLSFLTEVYYPQFANNPDGSKYLPPKDVDKIRRRLARAEPPGFWKDHV
jgi:capsular polysaccharide export protein